jgi:hypothetical protein
MKRSLLIFILFLIAIIAIFFIFINPTLDKNTPNSSTDNTKSDSCSNNICQYNDFTFEYPSNWKIQDNYSNYQNIYVYSPDYKQSTDGIIILEDGAAISFVVKDTDYTDLETYFSSDPLLSKIAQNKIDTTVDSQKSIQYDFSYEATTATDTVFINDGKLYILRMSYYDNTGKLNHWNEYKKFVDSFQLQ